MSPGPGVRVIASPDIGGRTDHGSLPLPVQNDASVILGHRALLEDPSLSLTADTRPPGPNMSIEKAGQRLAEGERVKPVHEVSDIGERGRVMREDGDILRNDINYSRKERGGEMWQLNLLLNLILVYSLACDNTVQRAAPIMKVMCAVLSRLTITAYSPAGPTASHDISGRNLLVSTLPGVARRGVNGCRAQLMITHYQDTFTTSLSLHCVIGAIITKPGSQSQFLQEGSRYHHQAGVNIGFVICKKKRRT